MRVEAQAIKKDMPADLLQQTESRIYTFNAEDLTIKLCLIESKRRKLILRFPEVCSEEDDTICWSCFSSGDVLVDILKWGDAKSFGKIDTYEAKLKELLGLKNSYALTIKHLKLTRAGILNAMEKAAINRSLEENEQELLKVEREIDSIHKIISRLKKAKHTYDQ
jgi:hypothetical protein